MVLQTPKLHAGDAKNYAQAGVALLYNINGSVLDDFLQELLQVTFISINDLPSIFPTGYQQVAQTKVFFDKLNNITQLC